MCAKDALIPTSPHKRGEVKPAAKNLRFAIGERPQ
jgi:hypothetical protein